MEEDRKSSHQKFVLGNKASSTALIDQKASRRNDFRRKVAEPDTSPATPSLLLDIISKSLLTKAELIAVYLSQPCHKLLKLTMLERSRSLLVT